MKSMRKIAIMHCKYKFLVWMEGNARECEAKAGNS